MVAPVRQYPGEERSTLWPLDKTIQELHAEKERVDRVIASLEEQCRLRDGITQVGSNLFRQRRDAARIVHSDKIKVPSVVLFEPLAECHSFHHDEWNNGGDTDTRLVFGSVR
jgi:hypothetical protein